VNSWFPVAEQWLGDMLRELPHVKSVVMLRNQQPLLLEHSLGKGRIVTCLTAAGPLLSPDGLAWTNWANGPAAPSYAVFQLDLVRYLARREQTQLRRSVGEPLQQVFSRTEFSDEVEFVSPDGHVTQIKAVPVSDPQDAKPDGLVPLSVTYRNTDGPGVYAVRMTTTAGQPQEQQFAFNVPADEGDLKLVAGSDVLSALGPVERLTIQAPGEFDWIRSEAPGEDIRWGLLMLLVAVMIAEQALAYRLSYHPVVPRRVPAPAT
jgi:hypothetical protein